MTFCTLFDSYYMPQGLTMIYSLLKVNPNCFIYVVAMDEDCYKLLKKTVNNRVSIINLNEVENKYPQLKKTKTHRTKPEYYFTSKGFICHYIIQKEKQIDSVTYLDSDLYFFSDPQSIFDELKEASVGITKHNFHWLSLHQQKYGKFNAGWITFKTTTEGLKCLEEWMVDCSNWCFGYLDGQKYGDQKYLDSWGEKYKSVKVIKTKGANLAPWNIKKYSIKTKGNQILIDEDILIFYHFSKLYQVNSNQFKTNLNRFFVSIGGIIKDKIYLPYLTKLVNHQTSSIKILSNSNRNKTFKGRFLNLERKIRDYFFDDIISVKQVIHDQDN